MTLFGFSIQTGLARTGLVLPASLTNLVLQSSLASLHQATRARRVDYVILLE